MKYPLILLAASFLALAGCEEQGPAERLGENIDDGAEEARDFAEDTADSISAEAERVGERLEEAGNDNQ